VGKTAPGGPGSESERSGLYRPVAVAWGEEAFCPVCGYPLPVGISAFCDQCGAPLG
jgi:hypothetical protein